MLRLTRTAIGLLTAQYRSVLRKCWAINVGIFALGAVAATTVLPSEAEAKSGSGDILGGALVNTGTLANVSSYSGYEAYSTNGNAKGGAIYNTGTINQIGTSSSSKNTYNNNTARSTNYYAGGGAIYNRGGRIGNVYADFGSNGVTATTGENTRGGAIINDSENSATRSVIGNIVGNFTNNYAQSRTIYGGAIANWGNSDIGDITGDFVGNHGTFILLAWSSAIMNFKNSTIGDIRGDFRNNSLTGTGKGVGGAISNSENTTIGDIIGDFENNTVNAKEAYGAAIYNGTDSVIGNIRGNFTNNSVTADGDQASGGAIENHNHSSITSITGNFINNYASNSNSDWDANGGAIWNVIDSTIGSIMGTFTGNYAISTSTNAFGGAIDNRFDYGEGAPTITTIGSASDRSQFSGNYAKTTAANKNAFGGAISNGDKIVDDTGSAYIGTLYADFEGNYAQATGTGGKAYGGAIYNGSGTIGAITGTFTDNYVSGSDARGGAVYNSSTITFVGNSTFTNNTANSSPNDIYNDGGTINIGKDASNTANVVLNSGYNGANSSSAKLVINSGSVLDINENNNVSPRASNLGAVTNSGTIRLGVDVNASATDTFNFASYTGSGSIILDAIHAIAGAYTLNQDYTVLTGTTGSAVLTLPNGGTSDTIATVTSSSPVATAITDAMTWDTKYTNTWTDTTETYGVSLTSDRKGFKITSGNISSENTGRGDVLAALNQNTYYDTKSFNATNTAPDYTTTESLGNTYGTLNVNGLGLGASTLTIGSGFDGFNIGSGARVNLSGLTLSGGSAYAANLAGGTLGLTNVTANGAKITGSSGSLIMNDTNTINGNLAYSGAKTIESGTTTFNGTVNGFTNNGTVNVGASNLTGAATNNGTLNLSSGTLGSNISGTGTTSVAGGQNVTNSATISSALNNAGMLDNNGTLSGTVNNSGTLMTAANTLTGSSVTNNGTLELEGGTLTTSLLGTGRMKLMSGRMRLLSSTPPATTGSLSFGDSDDDVFVNSILTSSSRISTSNNAIATGGYLDNNYYRKNKKSGILNGVKEGKKTTFNTSSQNSAKKICANNHNNFHITEKPANCRLCSFF